MKDKRLVVLVDAALMNALKAEQKSTGASVGEITRRALTAYLKKK